MGNVLKAQAKLLVSTSIRKRVTWLLLGVNDKSKSYLTLIVPADHRVLLSKNISSKVTNPLGLQPGP
jgi:hypothetical protein